VSPPAPLTLAGILQGFFTDRLARQRQASPHTIAAYRDTIRLLVQFTARATGKRPDQLDLSDLDVARVTAFLDHLQTDRGNTVSSRNARLTAIRSLYRYAYLHAPQHAALIERVLAVPPKRTDRTIVDYLTREETEALLAAPDQGTWHGRRDHALLALAVQTGLRVSELTALRITDVQLGAAPHVRCHGKGRKDRVTPMTRANTRTLRAWLVERATNPGDALFPTRTGRALSTDAVALLLAKHTAAAARTCPSLNSRRITPHTLRHSAAVALLQAGVDTSVIALWLGHEQTATTLVYLHADLQTKQQALARVRPTDDPPGRYKPPDDVIAFLDSL